MNSDLVAAQVWFVGTIVSPGDDWIMFGMGLLFTWSGIKRFYDERAHAQEQSRLIALALADIQKNS